MKSIIFIYSIGNCYVEQKYFNFSKNTISLRNRIFHFSKLHIIKFNILILYYLMFKFLTNRII